MWAVVASFFARKRLDERCLCVQLGTGSFLITVKFVVVHLSQFRTPTHWWSHCRNGIFGSLLLVENQIFSAHGRGLGVTENV